MRSSHTNPVTRPHGHFTALTIWRLLARRASKRDWNIYKRTVILNNLRGTSNTTHSLFRELDFVASNNFVQLHRSRGFITSPALLSGVPRWLWQGSVYFLLIPYLHSRCSSPLVAPSGTGNLLSGILVAEFSLVLCPPSTTPSWPLWWEPSKLLPVLSDKVHRWSQCT